MITIKKITENIVERHKDRIAELEKQIDAELELKWEAGERKIVVDIGVIPREVLDHLAQMYRTGKVWRVGIKSSKPGAFPTVYDQLEFEQYVEYSGGGRD